MSNNALNKSVAGFLAKVLQLDSGTQKTVTAKMGFVINGTPMSQPQVLAKLKQIEGVFSDIDDARNVLKQKVAARRAAIPAAKLFVAAYEAALKAQFGVQSPLLETFGISIQKPRAARSAEKNVLAAAQGRRTRRIRGTKGPKQKAAITLTGEPGLVVVSPTGELLPDLAKAPIAPGVEAPQSPSAAPASPASGGSGSGSNSGTGSGSAK